MSAVTPTSPRVAVALIAGVLGVLVATHSAGTYARWYDDTSVAAGELATGEVDLTLDAPPVVELLSVQPSGSRTYASASTCAAPSGYVECRVVSTSLPDERLVPGDTVRIRQSATLSATGENLRGDLTVDATGLVQSGTSPLSGAAQVGGVVSPPGGDTTPLSGGSATFAVDVLDDTGIGTYDVEADVVIPADDGGARWGTALRSQLLDLDTLTIDFVQTR